MQKRTYTGAPMAAETVAAPQQRPGVFLYASAVFMTFAGVFAFTYQFIG